MNRALLAAFGWLVPGGAYLVMRRYAQFAVFAVVVTAAFVAGLALQGGIGVPSGADLVGLDGFTAFAFKIAAMSKGLAGAPYLIARVAMAPAGFADSRLHEFGGALLMMAGLLNVLAISSALDQRKDEAR